MAMRRTKGAVSVALSATLALSMAPAAWAEPAAEVPEAESQVSAAEAQAGDQAAASTAQAQAAGAEETAGAETSADEASEAETRAVEELAQGAALDAGAVAVEEGRAGLTAEARDANVAATLSLTRAGGLVTGLSDEFKYFTRYESSCNYDQGFSSGDGYHAVGYYQFDNRYSLQPFLEYCYEYDPATYAMFAFAADPTVDIAGSAMYDYAAVDPATGEQGMLTPLGQQIEDAWHAAYAATGGDDGEFAALQDTYAYNNYYVTAENYLASQGIDISSRADCVKGLCWGVCNLFGSGGWRQFVGGTFNGAYYPGCGLSNDMSDVEFAMALTQYIVDHVAEFYPSQPQYHEGWQNRYRNEQRECLSYLPDLVPGAWYAEAVDYVQANGLMSGYAGGALDGRFGPEDRITRGQIATVLYRWFMGSSQDAYYASLDRFSDVADGSYYEAAINWAYEAGIVSGYGGTDAFGPDDYASREQVAVIMARTAAHYGWNVEANSGAWWGLADAGAVSSYAQTGIAWCYDQGIMSGSVGADGIARLNPQGSCTRAQFAKMVMALTRDVL